MRIRGEAAATPSTPPAATTAEPPEPYKCLPCGREVFSSAEDLAAHIREKHAGDNRPELLTTASETWPTAVSPRTMREAMANYHDGTTGAALSEEVCAVCARRQLATAGRLLEFGGRSSQTRAQRQRLSHLLSARAMHKRIRRTEEERQAGFIGLEWATLRDTGVGIPAAFRCGPASAPHRLGRKRRRRGREESSDEGDGPSPGAATLPDDDGMSSDPRRDRSCCPAC